MGLRRIVALQIALLETWRRCAAPKVAVCDARVLGRLTNGGRFWRKCMFIFFRLFTALCFARSRGAAPPLGPQLRNEISVWTAL